MNTPVHLIIGAAVFGRRGAPGRTWAAVLGGFAPDVSLYLMAGASMFFMGMTPGRVFGDLYYSPEWQRIFAIDNSFVLWGFGCALAFWTHRDWAVAFTGAALLHLVFDFPLHSHDARAHFWPLTDWKFISPVSYWEGASGRLIGWLELALTVSLVTILLIRHLDWRARAGFASLAATQLAPMVIWSIMF